MVAVSQIAPYFVMDRMAIPAIPGIYIAALYAGALRHVKVIVVIPCVRPNNTVVLQLYNKTKSWMIDGNESTKEKAN